MSKIISGWAKTISVICTLVLAFAALAALILSELGAQRTELGTLRTELGTLRVQMQAEHADIRGQLNSVDRRTARIEGHLFGIELAPESPDSE